MIVVLVGQPNSGKSTIFNSVAGYRTAVANFPGTTVEFTCSTVDCGGERFELAEIPGIYSMSSSSEDERQARDRLLDLGPDVIVNVIDASLLGRSLELTLELLDLGRPLVVCLNMMDEAHRKGTRIDTDHLSRDLGVPVIRAVATRGEGIAELFRAAVEAARRGTHAAAFLMSRDVESAVQSLASRIGDGKAKEAGLPARLLALKLLERDEDIEEKAAGLDRDLVDEARRLGKGIEEAHGRPPDVVIASERHALTLNLFEHVAEVRTRATRSLRDRVDHFVMHPLWGPAIMALVLLGFFFFVFVAGKLVETPLLGLFGRLDRALGAALPGGSLGLTLARGIVQGFSGGIGIVLPYLVPFLVGMALLEDVGYIPRAAFLMDALMHRIGLHGKAIIPLVLGYGCTVPAVMGTRIMENARDRWVTAVLANFIPCAARTTIIFALIGFYLGPLGALSFYLLDIVVVAAAGRLLLRLRPETSPGLILEIPPYRVPAAGAVARKVWFRLREFVVIAWPILIAGSVVLGLLDHFSLSAAVNAVLSPLTQGLLGLPPETGITLVFGVLRKELTIVMLVQALGTSDFGSVLTTGQMAVFTAFSLFYVPCLATLAALRSVIGARGMLAALGLTTAAAVVIAVAVRLVFLGLG
jgi:ferrous iron transport protein B